MTKQDIKAPGPLVPMRLAYSLTDDIWESYPTTESVQRIRSFLAEQKLQVLVLGLNPVVWTLILASLRVLFSDLRFLLHINDLPECVISKNRLFAGNCLIHSARRPPPPSNIHPELFTRMTNIMNVTCDEVHSSN